MNIQQLPPKQQQKPLMTLLKQVTKDIEAIISTGMPTASESTVKQFEQAFKQASSIGLTRLGSNLRLLMQEIQRYVQQDNAFSSRRLSFFLNRCWLMCKGLSEALDKQNAVLWQSLSFSEQTKSFSELDCMTLGVSKKMVSGVFAAFEFRLRMTDEEHELANKLISFSLIFPLPKAQKIHPEAYLDFDQKQGYRPRELLENAFKFNKAVVSYESHQRVRVSLLPDSQVSFLNPAISLPHFTRLIQCQPKVARQQLSQYKPSPFDLEIDLQTEVLLVDWQMSEPYQAIGFPDRLAINISATGNDYVALISTSEEGKALLLAMKRLAKLPSKPALFALMHYELGQRVLQPLSVITSNGIEHLMLGEDKTDYKTLFKQFSQ
ncbi:hypothetical protein [Motilimonas pumila]|uniref:Uncharacterized protein n=1 Tax=Motilimonas pumila TaxID=2303987 RepID=A0A418Y9P9_9GAMM|nr:hypothetical protein [Motilimonas pumila]RJG37989.1 hypothetical protein D1Z90_19375 [Motilimonas pumila]